MAATGIPSPRGTYDNFARHVAHGPCVVSSTSGSDTAAPAGTGTNVLVSGPFPQPTPGPDEAFLEIADITIVISIGATAPTALTLAALGQTFTVPTVLLVANANLLIGVSLGGLQNPPGPGGIPAQAVTVTPTAQAVTVRANSTAQYQVWPVGPF